MNNFTPLDLDDILRKQSKKKSITSIVNLTLLFFKDKLKNMTFFKK